MKVAVEQIFDGSIQQVALGGPYDATKINRGKHTGQYNIGPGPLDKFIGPTPVAAGGLGEAPGAFGILMMDVVKISDDLFWIFSATGASGSTTRGVQLVEWIPSTNAYNYKGVVTLTFPLTGNQTARGLRAILENYTTGTVGVSGTAVTGSGTAWNTGLSVGSRIGFGSTDPTQITQWYAISAIGSDTSITLATSAGTVSSGTPYVIQDLMILMTTNNISTAANGGLYVAKGLRYEDFGGVVATVIPAATTVDKIKAVYFLRDAATNTNTNSNGVAKDDRVSWTEQYCYSVSGTTTTGLIYKYNFRAPLTVSGGAATLTGSDMVVTGSQTLTGNIITTVNGRIATLSHGPGSGIPSLYFATSTRIYRVALSNIVSGGTNFLSDSMAEVPPSGVATVASSGGFLALDISTVLDKLIILAAASNGGVYITEYYADGSQLNRRAGHISSYGVSGARDTDLPVYVHNIGASAPTIAVEDGWLFWSYITGSATVNSRVSGYPLAADWEYQHKVNNRVICPKIALGESPKKLYRVAVNAMENLGENSFGISPDAYRIQVRISGIDDDSGRWIDIPQNGDLSGIGATSVIQFAFQFRTAGVMMLPARVLSLALIYETEDELPPQYRWNFTDYNASNGTFAWVQKSLFGTTPGTHTINIYRSDTNQLVLTQASTGTTNGTFENWNGSAWVAGIGADTVGRRRRFVPSASLPASVDLYAELTVA